MKRRSTQAQFGDGGTKLIQYTGEMPANFGPFVTKKIYRFREGKNPRLVDLRDLTLLTKVAGRDNLLEVDPSGRPKPPKRVRTVKKVKAQEVKTNGTE